MERERTAQVKSESTVVGATATTTLFWLVVSFALIFTLFTLAFPATFVDFYEDIGNQARAYDCADRAVEKAFGDDKVNLRIKCVNLALLIAEDDAEYYPEVEKHTQAFLFDDECVNRAVLIDDYSVYSTSPLLHPSIYGYADYLRECNAKARAKQGKVSVLVGNEYKTIADALSLSPTTETLLQICAVLGVTDEVGVTDLQLCAYAKSYYLQAVSEIATEPTLSDLYELYSYGKMVQRLTTVFTGIENELVSSVEYGGNALSPDELYKKLIREYAENYQR